MGRDSRIEAPAGAEAEAAAAERYGVLVGWTHAPCGNGINLKLQSTASKAALRRGEVEANHLLMTRNQALLLARYLLDATGQTLALPERPHGWRAWWARFTDRTTP